MTRVKIELLKVECKDTEDVTGADEFYLVGALAGEKIKKNFRKAYRVKVPKLLPSPFIDK